MGFQNYVANENRRIRKQIDHKYYMIKNFKSDRQKWRFKKVIILCFFLYIGFVTLTSITTTGIFSFLPLGIAIWYIMKWRKQEEEMGNTIN